MTTDLAVYSAFAMYQRTVLMIDVRNTDRCLMNNAFDEAGCGWKFIGVGDTGEAFRRLSTDLLPDLILLTLDPDAAGLQF